MKKLKVLVFDIETSAMLVWIWELGEQRVSVDQIHKDWHLMAWAAKWLGDKPSDIIYADQRNAKDVSDDRALLEKLWKLLDEADIVVTQNGVNFDSKKINARFIMHGIKPPSPYRHLDTLQIAKRVASFTSNKLEYLTDKLCTKYKKLSHSEFPGRSLWINCLKGNPKAWDAMRKYNIHDVLATEELYTKIRAWAPENMPDVFFGADSVNECRTCGTVGKMRIGSMRVTKSCKYRRYQCQSCGSWAKGEKITEKEAA
jgi:DNA polymerase elongation subunit (family B)